MGGVKVEFGGYVYEDIRHGDVCAIARSDDGVCTDPSCTGCMSTCVGWTAAGGVRAAEEAFRSLGKRRHRTLQLGWLLVPTAKRDQLVGLGFMIDLFVLGFRGRSSDHRSS